MSMNVSNIDLDSLKPTLLMVFYESKNSHYAEYAEIDDDRIGDYKPLVYELFHEFSKKLKEKEKKQVLMSFKGLLPKNVIIVNNDGLNIELAWTVPSTVRKIFLNNKEGYLIYPNLLFYVKNNNLHLFALKDIEVNEKTQLYICPFPNIYSDGHMCFGTLNKKELLNGDFSTIMKNMEDAFFNSKFTNTLMQDSPTKVPTLALLEDCISPNKKKAKCIPFNHLKQYKLLKNVLSK